RRKQRLYRFSLGHPLLNRTPHPESSVSGENSTPSLSSAATHFCTVPCRASAPLSSKSVIVGAPTPLLLASSARLQPKSARAARSCEAMTIKVGLTELLKFLKFPTND